MAWRAVRATTTSVDSMDATKALEDESVECAALPARCPSTSSNQRRHGSREPSRSRFVCRRLRLLGSPRPARAALCLIGPLHGLAPIRLIIPQGAMFGVVCVLYVIADRVPVELPFRGTTYAFVLNEVPLLFGLAFLAPNILVLASVCADRSSPSPSCAGRTLMKVAFNVASLAFATALAATVFRELLGHHSPVSLLGWAAAAVALVTNQITTRSHCGSSPRSAARGRSRGPASSCWRSRPCSRRRASASPSRSSMPPGSIPGRPCPSWSSPA